MRSNKNRCVKSKDRQPLKSTWIGWGWETKNSGTGKEAVSSNGWRTTVVQELLFDQYISCAWYVYVDEEPFATGRKKVTHIVTNIIFEILLWSCSNTFNVGLPSNFYLKSYVSAQKKIVPLTLQAEQCQADLSWKIRLNLVLSCIHVTGSCDTML